MDITTVHPLVRFWRCMIKPGSQGIYPIILVNNMKNPKIGGFKPFGALVRFCQCMIKPGSKGIYRTGYNNNNL